MNVEVIMNPMEHFRAREETFKAKVRELYPYAEDMELTSFEHDAILAMAKAEMPAIGETRARLEVILLFAEADMLFVPNPGDWFMHQRTVVHDYREEMGWSETHFMRISRDDAAKSVLIAVRKILKFPTH